MRIGYIRVSKSDGRQVLDLQRDALLEAGVEAARIYSDLDSGRKDDRPGLATCLQSLQPGNALVVWKLRLPWSQPQASGRGSGGRTEPARGRFAGANGGRCSIGPGAYLRRTCSRTRERPLGWETTQDDAGTEQ